MSYAAPNGGAIKVNQTPYIIEINSTASPMAVARLSTEALPAFVSRTDKGLIVNGTLVETENIQAT